MFCMASNKELVSLECNRSLACEASVTGVLCDIEQVPTTSVVQGLYRVLLDTQEPTDILFICPHILQRSAHCFCQHAILHYRLCLTSCHMKEFSEKIKREAILYQEIHCAGHHDVI